MKDSRASCGAQLSLPACNTDHPSSPGIDRRLSASSRTLRRNGSGMPRPRSRRNRLAVRDPRTRDDSPTAPTRRPRAPGEGGEVGALLVGRFGPKPPPFVDLDPRPVAVALGELTRARFRTVRDVDVRLRGSRGSTRNPSRHARGCPRGAPSHVLDPPAVSTEPRPRRTPRSGPAPARGSVPGRGRVPRSTPRRDSPPRTSPPSPLVHACDGP